MSVENIKAFSVVGLEKHFDEVVMLLGKSKVFQPDDVKNFYQDKDTKGFTNFPTANPFAEPLSLVSNAMSTLRLEPKFVKTKINFNPDLKRINKFAKKLSKHTDKLAKAKQVAKQQVNECKRAIEETSHFVSIEHNIDQLLNMKYVTATFGRLPVENLGALESDEAQKLLFEFVQCSNENNYVWGIYFTPTKNKKEVDKLFTRLYFEQSKFASSDKTPAERLEELESDLYRLQGNYEGCKKAMELYLKEKQGKILKYYTKISEFNLYYTIKAKAMRYNNIFILTGWIPEDKAEEIQKKLKKVRSVEVSVANGKEELQLSPPIRLKNNFFTRPYQFYTEMYGVPKYKEIDPTAFVAITYTLLFGIMFGDIGHGFCVIIAGLLMWYLKKMAIGKILIPCGISGMFFGALFGSTFGFENSMDWFYVGILKMKEKPIEVMSPSMTNNILYVAVIIGMSLLLIAMLLNMYSCIRQGDFGKMLFDTSGICGFIFYGMICAGVLGMMLFNTNLFSLPYIIVIAISFILIFFREPLGDLVNGKDNWKPESIGGFIMENIFESIEVLLSYVTNTMSFLRVSAFVLVHAGMMQVVFTLANMSGGVGYVIILIIGNGLVCALEALLVSIQVLRLEYYEMFSHFYSGEGRPYEPIKLSLVKN